jgi:ParB family chromosome partitioning protein
MTYRVRSIKITKIEPNCRCVYDPASIDEMIRSISKEGQIHPIKIWFTGRCFRILDGEKRWRACKKMGICELKAVIVEDIDE